MAGRKTMIPLSIRQASEKCMRSQEGLQQLFPGIPDDVTLDKISPKMPWKVFYVLSLVSRAWLHAIRSRKVYDARILSHSPETNIICSHYVVARGIILRSMRDFSGTQLPPTSYRRSQVVPLDGKIYVLGGEDESGLPINKAFVFDVAGQMQWKECASMNEPRVGFGCGVIHGKIYVIGGRASTMELLQPCGPEVYDPKQNLWSPIKPMARQYNRPQVISLGEELVVHGDSYYGSELSGQIWDVYHPVKDEWRVVKTIRRDGYNHLFVARGNLHMIDAKEICVYDAMENSWRLLHSCSFSSIESAVSLEVFVIGVYFVDDELLVLLYKRNPCKVLLKQSKGFGSTKKELIWQEVRYVALPINSNPLIQL